jgi:ABC-2 type transport system permease protein
MNASQITRKDLLLLFRDRRTLSVLIALPLAFIAIIGSSTGQLFSEAGAARKIKVGIVDAQHSQQSIQVVDELHGIEALEISAFDDRPVGRTALALDKIHVLLFIGPAFDNRVAALEVYDVLHPDEGRLGGRLKSLDISVESGSFLANASELVEIVVFAKTLQTVAGPVVKKDSKLARQIMRAGSRSASDLEESPQEQPADSTEPSGKSSAGARNFNSIVYQTVVPGYTVMFVFFIVTFMARSFIGERELGTLNRLQLAPVSHSGIMIGKTVPFLCISLVQTALLFLAGRVLFGMEWGVQPLLIVPVMLCTSVAATALGLLVASLVRTEAQVSAYGNFLVLTMAGISGCMMPRNWQPELMQQVGLVTPHAWALIAYDQILNRPEPEMTVVVRCCLVMLAFAVGFFSIGWWRSRKMD